MWDANEKGNYANLTKTASEHGGVDNFIADIHDEGYQKGHERGLLEEAGGATVVKVNQIKPDKFKEWNYKAVEMRDRCQNGEITPAEFEEWLYNSFKNRKKK